MPNDADRFAAGTTLTYMAFDVLGVSDEGATLEPAVESSFRTWDQGTQCSNLPIVEREFTPGGPSFRRFSCAA